MCDVDATAFTCEQTSPYWQVKCFRLNFYDSMNIRAYYIYEKLLV